MSFMSNPSSPSALPLRTALYGSGSNINMGLALVQNTLQATTLLVPNSCKAISLGISVTTGAVGNAVRLGIFRDNGGYPGTLLLDAGTVVATGAAFVQAVINQALTPGIYWLASILQGGTGAAVESFSYPFLGVPLLSFQSALSPAGLVSPVAYTGALPATFDANATVNSPMPHVLLGIQ